MVSPARKTVGKYFGAIAMVLPALFSTSAGATCPTFHTLTNGNTADATQVMDNFNYILQCPNFTGNVGIGVTASHALDILQNQNAASLIQIKNTDNGATASAYVIAHNGTKNTGIIQMGTGFSQIGIFRQDGGMLYSDGSGGLTLAVLNSQPMYFATSSTQRAVLSSGGAWQWNAYGAGTLTSDASGNITSASDE